MAVTRLPAATEAPGKHRLERGTLGFFDSIVMSVAGSAPAYTIAATTAALVAAVGLGASATLLYCAIPMFGIAIAYYQLNKLDANAGAAYAWVGRVLHPVLGFFAGWALVVSATIFMVAGSLPAGSVTLSLFSSHAADQLGLVTAVGAIWFLVMAYFVARGVRVTTNAQWIMSSVEICLLLLFVILGFVHAGSHPHLSLSWSWFDFAHIDSFDVFTAGALIAAFYFWGWDVSSNLNEETKDSTRSSGLGGIVGVAVVFVLFELFTVAINMVVPAKQISVNAGNVLGYFGQVVWPGVGGKLLVLAVMLSTVATLETTLIQVTRSLYAMARERTLPARFGRIHPRWHTPVFATVVVAIVSLSLFVASNFIGSVDTCLTDAISAIGLQISLYYGLAGLAAVVAFRKHLLDSVRSFLLCGLLPAFGSAFMFWVFIDAIPRQSLAVNALGLGALALALVPLGYYWWRSRFLRTAPTLGGGGRLEPARGSESLEPDPGGATAEA